MNFKEFKDEYDCLNSLKVEKRYRSQDLVFLYKEYISLKEKMLGISLVLLKEEEIEKLEIIKVSILESLCLLEIELRRIAVKDLTESYAKLEKIYEK